MPTQDPLHPARLEVAAIDPNAHRAVFAMESYVRGSGLDPKLYELIKIRASELNGCAYCLDMHLREARELGENQRRLDVLSAWREEPSVFTSSERATLALTEAVTLISERGVPEDIWNDAATHLGEAALPPL